LNGDISTFLRDRRELAALLQVSLPDGWLPGGISLPQRLRRIKSFDWKAASLFIYQEGVLVGNAVGAAR
jgi:hypothetical protein